MTKHDKRRGDGERETSYDRDTGSGRRSGKSSHPHHSSSTTTPVSNSYLKEAKRVRSYTDDFDKTPKGGRRGGVGDGNDAHDRLSKKPLESTPLENKRSSSEYTSNSKSVAPQSGKGDARRRGLLVVEDTTENEVHKKRAVKDKVFLYITETENSTLPEASADVGIILGKKKALVATGGPSDAAANKIVFRSKTDRELSKQTQEIEEEREERRRYKALQQKNRIFSHAGAGDTGRTAHSDKSYSRHRTDDRYHNVSDKPRNSSTDTAGGQTSGQDVNHKSKSFFTSDDNKSSTFPENGNNDNNASSTTNIPKARGSRWTSVAELRRRVLAAANALDNPAADADAHNPTQTGPFDRPSESFLAKLELLPADNLSDATKQHPVNSRELEQIREHYLGIRKEKRKIQKPSEKFRNIFNFEWDATEDTARGDSNPLYQNRTEPQLLFGRGFRAGVDIREQRKHNNFYDELVKRRSEKGVTAEIQSSSGLVVPKYKSQLLRQRDIESNDPNRLHWSEKTREAMTERDWRIFREDFEIYIKGGRVPPPMRSWAESGLAWELMEAVKSEGYTKPTSIQMQAVPIALEQRDLIGIAETGSGKTAAFVLPLLTYVNKLPPLNDETCQDGPYGLVLAPSRELALQIEEETKKFSAYCHCRAVGVVGGRNAEAQAFELRKGAELVIGTPGRIKDCLEKSYTVLNQCNYVVLDEADRMIDLGFEEIVNWILDQIPMTNQKSEDEDTALRQELEAKAGHRQYRLTHMFSATMPPALERLARKYLRAPAYISIGDPGAGKRSIEQRLEFLPEGKKKQRLQEVLHTVDMPVMVFTNQKKVADILAKQLQKLGFRSASLHGGKAQETREASLQGFREGEFDILVATDVAGRGIDVDDVQTVVNFDMPRDIESYTHRIGRTGRMGKKGLSISFVTEDDSGVFYDLKQLLVSTNNIVPFELMQHPAAKAKPGAIGSSAQGSSKIK